MNKTRIAIAASAIFGALALAACGGGVGETANAPRTPGPAEPVLGASGEGTVLAGVPHGADEFIGMPLDVAASFAEEQGRQWRVGHRDGEDLVLTADFMSGRVTFTVEDGIVTAASIEEEEGQDVAPPAEASQALSSG